MKPALSPSEQKALLANIQQDVYPDERGRFGPYGGRYVPETLVPCAGAAAWCTAVASRTRAEHVDALCDQRRHHRLAADQGTEPRRPPHAKPAQSQPSMSSHAAHAA